MSIGCGGGQKDARWLKAVANAGRAAPRVTLTDTSAALVITADRAVRAAGATDVDRVVLDLVATPNREAYGATNTPVIWSCLGILPNFEHTVLLPYLAKLLAPEDLLIVSANLSPRPRTPATEASLQSIVAQYDNPHARAWYDGALLELGLPLSALDRRMHTAAVDADGHVWRMQYRAALKVAAEISAVRQDHRLARGDRTAGLSVDTVYAARPARAVGRGGTDAMR